MTTRARAVARTAPGTEAAAQPAAPPEAGPRAASRRYAVARTAFGIVWAIDATFKWTPQFRGQFLDVVRDAGTGQPRWLHPWFSGWTRVLEMSPTSFAIGVAVLETLVALSLVLGLLQRVGFVVGTLLALLIWGVGEGFGGPYGAHSTDIGSAVIYCFVFAALWAVPDTVRAAAPGMDRRLRAAKITTRK